MNILLINVDNRWNLAVRRMYNFYRSDHNVEMIDLGFSGYPHKKKKTIDASKYDKVFVSNIFEINKDRVTVEGCEDVVFGGIGSRNPHLQLPEEIENTDPFYFDDEDTSYGFITRGCIRKCWFCKVPKHEGDLKFYNDIERIIKHKKVKFLDNNILAYEKHCEVFQWLIDRNIRCEFNQGLDFRLINDTNANLLSQLNYMGAYTFAFDDPKYQRLLEKKLKVIKKHIPEPWKVRFYIYYHPSMDILELFDRVEWCRENECLPYVMRDAECWECEDKDFLIDFASYCNQPAFFKKLSFDEYLDKNIEHKRYKPERVEKTRKKYHEYIGVKHVEFL